MNIKIIVLGNDIIRITICISRNFYPNRKMLARLMHTSHANIQPYRLATICLNCSKTAIKLRNKETINLAKTKNTCALSGSKMQLMYFTTIQNDWWVEFILKCVPRAPSLSPSLLKFIKFDASTTCSIKYILCWRSWCSESIMLLRRLDCSLYYKYFWQCALGLSVLRNYQRWPPLVRMDVIVICVK